MIEIRNQFRKISDVLLALAGQAQALDTLAQRGKSFLWMKQGKNRRKLRFRLIKCLCE